MTAVEKKVKQKSAFETACDTLKVSIDEKEQKKYELIKNVTAKWTKPLNPNKNCAVGTRTIKHHHCSNIIRQRLSAFISTNCSLHYCCFSKGVNCCQGFNIGSFKCVFKSTLVSSFRYALICNEKDTSSLLNTKNASSKLEQIIGVKQFDCTLIAACCGTEQSFWVKIIGDRAFVKACGTSQRTDCITFAPVIAIKCGDNGLMVLKSVKGLIGVGFCNIIEDPRRKTKRKHKIEGNAMIMIREDNIQHIEVALYTNNKATDFGIHFITNKLTKGGHDNPLCLYLQSHTININIVHVSTPTLPPPNDQYIANSYSGMHASRQVSESTDRYSPY